MEEFFAHIIPFLGTGATYYSAFDCDNTTINNDIAQSTLLYACKNELLRGDYLPISHSSKKDYHEKVFSHVMGMEGGNTPWLGYVEMAKAFAGFSPEELTALGRETISKRLGVQEFCGRTLNCTITPVTETRMIMDYLASHNLKHFMASASPAPLVQAVIDEFNICATVLGMRNIILEDKLTQEIEEPHCAFDGKVKNLQMYVDPLTRPLVTMGDSKNDVPLLEYGYCPIIVDRNNGLAQIAEQRAWPIIRLYHN